MAQRNITTARRTTARKDGPDVRPAAESLRLPPSFPVQVEVKETTAAGAQEMPSMPSVPRQRIRPPAPPLRKGETVAEIHPVEPTELVPPRARLAADDPMLDKHVDLSSVATSNDA